MGKKTGQQRIDQTFDYLLGISNINRYKVEAFLQVFLDLDADRAKAMGKAIHIPHAEKDKDWRDAMRAFLLVHLLFDQMGTQPTPDLITTGKAMRKANKHLAKQALLDQTRDRVNNFHLATRTIYSAQVLRALNKITKRYGQRIPMPDRLIQPFQGRELGKTVTVVEDSDWARVYLKQTIGTGRSDPASVNGLTQPSSLLKATWPRSIFLHGGAFTFGTMVHELLHFVCHDQFWTAWHTDEARARLGNSKHDEGITEFFTRKVAPDQDRSMTYPQEHAEIVVQIQKRKAFTEEDLVAAYFEGDEVALNKIQGKLDTKGRRQAIYLK